ncbi:transcriptional regulator with XRE-family HTH domain [Natronocella acetinitrilica]|uniref:Transcriptional regulator with XRE-family HTH domain n=1 Tax=Natronocella acetinitrilica TaxID=414046 RepID=A0AAE3KBJ2_9GAMM|nr:helix-turn-helix domain-containing protein [Natronocella acetinitrilica]MCP1673653.1 transcriptional regulator with XRE-family HTH domain [Natronocella acetinitrilica]
MMSQQAAEFSKTLGRRVRMIRGNELLTRRELAERSGVSERYLASLETGQANPSLAILFRLAGALELPIEKLLCPSVAEVPARSSQPEITHHRHHPIG